MEKHPYSKPILEVVGELHEVTAGLSILGINIDILGGGGGGSN
jgi:hypothetical protein